MRLRSLVENESGRAALHAVVGDEIIAAKEALLTRVHGRNAMLMRITTTALTLALVAAAPMRASAEDYKWPNNIPPEAKQLMEPLPLSPTGQAVPGFPNGAPAVSADGLKLTDDDIAKLKAGKHTAGLVMHTMDAGWPHLQVAGITNTLKDYGVEVIGATDAKFNVGQQISDLEQMIARKPDVIFSIPIDPKSESEAYKKAAAAGIKLVFLDNVPGRHDPGQRLRVCRRGRQ